MKLNKTLVVSIAVVLILAAAIATLKSVGREKATQPVAIGTGRVSLLVVGIEGLEPTIIDRLSNAGSIPNLTRLIRGGSYIQFDNLGKRIDARIPWTSLVTGMSPEDQGIGGQRMSRRGEMVDAQPIPKHRTAEAMWSLVEKDGSTVGVVGWPATWPVEEVKGVMVGPYVQYVLERELEGDSSAGVFPPALYERVDAMILDMTAKSRRDLVRFVDTDSAQGLESLIGKNYDVLSSSVAGDESVVAVAVSVVADPGVDNLIIYMGGLNPVCQRFWHYMEPEAIERGEFSPDVKRMLDGQMEALGSTIDLYYEYVDELLGTLLQYMDDDGTCAVISDHGYTGISFDPDGKPRVGYDMHSERGLCILAGPGVVAGTRINTADITDVAPTILSAAGVPIPEELDEGVLLGVLGN